MAIAGPLVSLVLGVAFSLLALAGFPSAVDGVVAWLGYINLTLLLFNLIPALPLDGGRVLRSALWYFRGDLAWATRVAADIGQGFGYLFIGLGIAMLILYGAFSGAWLAFLGWFLLQAARAEARFADGGSARRPAGPRPDGAGSGDRRPDLTIGQFMDEVAWSRAASRRIRSSTTAGRSG